MIACQRKRTILPQIGHRADRCSLYNHTGNVSAETPAQAAASALCPMPAGCRAIDRKLRRSLFSGCWRYVHVEGEGFGVGVIVLGIALEGERDGGQAFALGVLASSGSAAVDVQGRHAVMPVPGFLVCCRLPRWQTVCPASIFSGSAWRRVSPTTTPFAAVGNVGSLRECRPLAAHHDQLRAVAISLLVHC
jgi:hypothetical protein